MPRVTTRAAFIVFNVLIVLLPAARDASAQSVPMLKVVNDSATVRSRPAFMSDVVGKVKQGTILEAVDREDDWYWVILPPDDNGTRFPGWVRAHDVEIVAAGEPRAVLRHFVEAVEQAKVRMDAQAAEDAARLERARQKVEEARQAYDAVVKNGPAAAQSGAAPAQTAPVRVPRAARPHADVPREYEWFGGYSFYRDQSNSLSYGGGWALSGARQMTPTIDLVGSISGSHRSDDVLGVNLTSASVYTFVAGPKYTWPARDRFTPFAQVLIGIAAVHASVLGVGDSSAGFALQPGFGVDVPIRKPISFRVGFDVETIHASGGWFTGFRINTGVMFVTGTK